ncbi:MAG TPA: hypothetical protein VF045_01415 [Acidimicrobiales bacterium]
MSEPTSPPDSLGTALCEVCSQPMPPGAKPTRIGACEFPFNVHAECVEQMGPIAAEVEQLCAWAEDQPEGLLWLGSWDSAPEKDAESPA